MNLTDPTLTLPFALIFRIGPAPIVFPLPLLPQRASWDFPSRVSVQQTLGRNYVDRFSGKDSVLAQVTLQGTFGYHQGSFLGLALPPGSMTLKALETLFETFETLDRQVAKTLGATQEYVGLSRAHFWQIAITRFRYEMSEQNPLLYFYSLSFVRVLDYLSPAGPSLPTGTPGVSQGLGSALGNLVGGGAA